MDLICLAAGHGSRMGRLGVYLQKCMYPVGLRPFLEHTLEELHASGIAAGGRLALVVGHHARQLREYFGSEHEGLAIEYVEQSERLGTGHALSLAYRALRPEGSVVAWQADLFVTRRLFREVAGNAHGDAVTLGPGDQRESPALLATTEGELVTRVWNGAGPLYDIGLWKLSPATLAGIGRLKAPDGEVRMLPNLQRAIDSGARVGHVRAREWIHLGGTLPTPEENVRAVVSRLFELRGAEG